MTRKRLLRWGLPLLLLAALLSHQRQVLAAATVQWTGFERVDAWYVAPSLDAHAREALRVAEGEAHRRVERLYGPLRAQPRLIAADANTFSRFASGSTGTTHYLFWGEAITVLGPAGHNVDVLSHELAHAELLERVGFRALQLCVPTWFDEGLAVQFDERPPFSEQAYLERLRSGWPAPALEQLDTEARFFSGSRDEVRFRYAAARVAVGRWLRSLDPAAARSGIESISCSEAWRARFRQIAAR